MRTRIHFDLKGIAVVALTATCGLSAYLTNNNHLFALFSTLLAVTLLATVISLLSVRGLRVRRAFGGACFATEEFTYTVVIDNRKWLVPLFAITIADRISQDLHGESITRVSKPFPYLGPRRSAAIPVAVVPLYRGKASYNRIHLLTQFPLSPVVVERIIPCPDEIVVYPRLFALDRRFLRETMSMNEYFNAAVVPFTSGEDEFAGLHEFRTGDNPRHIHWKISARLRGRLFVREMESNRARDAVIRLDTRIPVVPEEARELRMRAQMRLERAISFTASLATILARENYRITFLSADASGAIHEEIEPSHAGIARLLTLLAHLRPDPAADEGRTRTHFSIHPSFVSFYVTPREGAGNDAAIRSSTIVIGPREMKRMIIREGAYAGETA